MTDLTVVIVTFNSVDQLPACAAALELALTDLTSRIVVVDNASADDSLATVHAQWPDAEVIANATNQGFGPAANQGVAAAVGRCTLLLNPDALPGADAIARLVQFMDSNPTVGIVAPRLIDNSSRPVLSCYPFPSLRSTAWRYLHLHRVLPNRGGGRYRQLTLGASGPLLVPWAQGACLLLRRQMLNQIGGFDERFVMYAEEVDLARRGASAGWHCAYLPNAIVRHQEATSTVRVPRFKLASHYFSAVQYFEIHEPRQLPLVKSLFLVDLTTRWLARLPAVITGRPADAAERRSAYALIARSLLFDSPARRHSRWRALASSARPRP